ncbi:WxL domain-containing protein [Carnobacterium divergens]|uniref:WxL domain-containing protein n=1 Tax=Carnobacterium divergens TaxID=2748 RepID=UPI00289218CA|nr:WxL domain-containing protein [Carnobacterium divergens]MDT2012744.1 WxL domain-containing protein [Carnobacterium divergens]
MNLKKATIAMVLVSSLVLTSSPIVHGATANTANSKTHIQFKANPEPTDPLNPIDPNNPEKPPVDPEDPNNEGTGNKGPLSIDYISNVEFGEKEIQSGDTVYNAKNENPYVQVTDKRGTGAGWKLSAKATPFKNKEGNKELIGTTLSVKNGQIKTRANNVSEKAIHHDVIFNNEDAQVLMDAPVGAGRGTWVDVFSGKHGENENIQLTVLEGSADANIDYSAQITWELADAPK